MTLRFAPWIVVPVYDHEHAIVTTVERLLPHGAPILLVDDGSRESCAEVLRTLAARYPARVSLLRLAQSHLSKIGGGAEVYYDKMITELLGDVTQSYPLRLSLQDQGIFQIGYYHQKQKLFTKKEEKDNG